jgi:thiol-disulfide isomerase/thioredoxin
MAADPSSFVARIGMALASPQWAFAIAGDRRNPGRSGSDLLRFIGMFLLGAHLRGLIVAAWLGLVVQPSLGLRAAGAVLSIAVTTPLAFLVIAAALLWIGSGPARHIGRAFDLAGVAVVPLILVSLLGATAVSVLQQAPRSMVALLAMGVGFGWAGALIMLALPTARVRVSVTAVPPPRVLQRGHRLGWAVMAVVAGAVVYQLGWIAAHVDDVRPVTQDQIAPSFALPDVGRDGALGARHPIVPASRTTVVDFWATWCGPCLATLPHLEALRLAHPEVDVVSINLDDAAKARQIFDQHAYGLRLFFDDAGVADRYGVSMLPHLVVIDGAGMVHEVKRGNPGELEALLRK